LRPQTTRAWLSVHLSPTAATQPLSLPSRYFLTSIFSRIRPVGFCESYTSFARHFCEEKLPAKTTPIPKRIRHQLVALITTNETPALLQAIGAAT
jgi:hypothetical protein